MLKSKWFIALLCLAAGLGIGMWLESGFRAMRVGLAEAGADYVLLTQSGAWNKGDLEGFMSHYLMSDDFTFYSDDSVTQGWVALNEGYRKKYGGTPELMGKLAFTGTKYDVLADDAVMVRGRWTVTDTPNAGTGLFTILIRNTPNGWKVVHDHTSAQK